MAAEPVLLAAADLGTNSFHLVVARVGREGRFEIVTRERDRVRLGHGGGDMKEISPEAMERGMAALARMQKLAGRASAPMRAVATSAVREASNAEEFIAGAHQLGIEVEVISGVEEARLIHLGVLQAVPVFDKRLILCDIGGGSTEILVGQGAEVRTARSFKAGAVRLTDRFFPDGEVTAAGVRAARAHLRSLFASYTREVAAERPKVGVGSSGTFEALVRLAHARSGKPELRTWNGQQLDRRALDEVIDDLLDRRTTAERLTLNGLDADRADIIVAGALILEAVYSAFGIKTMMFSEYALREGVLLDTLGRLDGSSMDHLHDVRRRGVRHLADLCDPEPAHARHVATLALQLFDATTRLHRLDTVARSYLEAGALLANVGLVISHDRHHLHSYYVIRNAEHLVGFTDHEIEIIAQIARYHRKSAPKPSHEDFQRLDEQGRHLVRSLAAILRIAIGLDRSHDGRVESLTARRRGGQLQVAIRATRDLADVPADLSLELYAAGERAALFTEVYGVEPIFTSA